MMPSCTIIYGDALSELRKIARLENEACGEDEWG